MRPIYGKIINIVFGLAIGVVLSEACVRVLWNRQIIRMDNLGVISYAFMRETSNPDIPFELKPDADIDISYPHYAGHVVTNRDGFRDREYPVQKRKGVYRIMVLGDSITFGFEIRENKDVYHSILEEMLNAEAPAGKRFEVIGTAVPGYNTCIEVNVLKEKGLKYDPDLVIFAYCLNDMRDSIYSCEYGRGLHLGCSNPSILKLPSFVRRQLRRSVLYSFLANKANMLRSYLSARSELKKARTTTEEPRQPARAALKPAVPSSVKLYFPTDSVWYSIYKESHKGDYISVMDRMILDDLEKMAKEHFFDVLFIIFPAFEKDPAYFPQGQLYAFEDAHATLRALFKKHGFLALDLKDYLQGRMFDEVAMDDCHLSLQGHRIVAGIVADYCKGYFKERY